MASGQIDACILIVDDDADVRAMLRRWTEHRSRQILEAANAEEALALCIRHDVDVALCDVEMPGKDGLWLASQLTAISQRIMVLFVTGLDSLPPRSTLAPRVDGYLVKPLQREHLIKAVVAATARARAAQSAPLIEALDPTLIDF